MPGHGDLRLVQICRSLPQGNDQESSKKRGNYFENVFIPWFLTTDPEWSSKIKKIWLWDDYPQRWGKDCGIDLVYEDEQGKHWAVQSKCVSPDRQISKAESERQQLQSALNSLVEGDELVVTSLSRLGRTQREVINRLHDLQEQGKHLRTLDGLVDTKGLGKFAPVLIGLLTGLNSVEREQVRERTLESIQHRRETGGNLGGRPKTPPAKRDLVLRLRSEGCSYRSIHAQTGLALSTIRRVIAQQEALAA